MSVKVELHEAVVSQLRNGVLLQDMSRRMRNVETAAKRLCPVDTGRLRSSIASGAKLQGNEVVGRCGSNVYYAAFIEKGTRYIRPRHFLLRALPAAAQ